MLIVWKGIQLEIELSGVQVVIAVLATGAGVTGLEVLFILPYLWRRIMHEDWQLKWHHIWEGPYLLKRPPPGPPPRGINSLNIKDYYQGHLTLEELECLRASESLLQSIQSPSISDLEKSEYNSQPPSPQIVGIPPRPSGPWHRWQVLLWWFKRIALHGLEKDVIKMQKRNVLLRWNIEDMHARAPRYDNRAEYMYSALQILTAASASFIHGANDVANAIAPFASAFVIWRSGTVHNKAPVPVWVL